MFRKIIALLLLSACTVPAEFANWTPPQTPASPHATPPEKRQETITLAEDTRVIQPLGDFPAVRFVATQKLPITIHLRHLGGAVVKACLIEVRYFTGRFPNGGCVWSAKVDSRMKSPEKRVVQLAQGAMIPTPLAGVAVEIHPELEEKSARLAETITIEPGTWVLVLDNDGLVSNASAKFSITADIEY